MQMLRTTAGASIALALVLAGCGAPPSSNSPTPPPTQVAESTAAPSSGEPESPSSDQGVTGTVVHFTSDEAVVKVVLEGDNSTTRSFVAMLPMTLEFSDHGGKEKVATPTGDWDFTDAEGLDPEVGDLFSYMPWGNLGFYYNTEGNMFDSSVTKIGETEDIDQIELLDGQQVTIAVSR